MSNTSLIELTSEAMQNVNGGTNNLDCFLSGAIVVLGFATANPVGIAIGVVGALATC